MKNKIIDWLKEELNKSKAKGFIIGISGGIDSAVVAGLAQKATKNVLGVWIDIESSNKFYENAKLVFSKFKIEQLDLNLTTDFKRLNEKLSLTSFEDKKFLIQGNLKSRLRMLALYNLAQQKNYLVLGTSNKSEIYLGYFTKYGDSASDLMPIADLTKNEVFDLARDLEVPKKIINIPPSADLWNNQTDEEELGLTYDDLDKYFKKGNLSNDIKLKIEKMNSSSSHKRFLPKIYKK